jgi:hypothetical protein
MKFFPLSTLCIFCASMTLWWRPVPAMADALEAEPTVTPDHWEFREPKLPELAAILKGAKSNPHIYGLYTWTGEYRDHRDSIKKVGWKSFRSGGPLDDAAMKLYAADGVEVMGCIGPEKRPTAGANADNTAFVEAYARQVTAFVDRYGPAGSFFKENPSLPHNPIVNIEITNEPNFQYLIPDGPPQNVVEPQRPAVYAKLLPAAYAAAKAADPAVHVIGFATGGSGHGDTRFIQHVHDLNPAVATSYDALSTHPYCDAAPPEGWSIRSWGSYGPSGSFMEIRGIMNQHHRQDAPIWYTEVGWPISQQDGGRYTTKRDTVTPILQAAYICRLYAFAQRLGVERVHIMFCTDTDGFNGGFFLPDDTWRPSAHAVQTMIHVMPAPKLTGAISDGVGGTFIYQFAADDSAAAKPVIMAWTVQTPKMVDIPVDAKSATVTDMLGHSESIAAVNGKLHLEIGPLPVYVQGE